MNLRKATMRDIPAILELINAYAAEEIMLPRTEFEMAEDLRDFTVAGKGTEILACGALHFYTPTTGEVRSVAVAEPAKGIGIGKKLVKSLETEARSCGLATLFAFTYVPHFFEKLGFTGVDRSELPLKAWKDCMRCPKFRCCDELAMVKHLDGREDRPAARRTAAGADLAGIQLPVLKGRGRNP